MHSLSLCLQLTLSIIYLFFFFLNDPPTTEISPLPLHDALPIVIEPSEPARKLSRFRILTLLPAAVVPASPGMFVMLIAVADIADVARSPPIARGIAVMPMPASSPQEAPLRISPPNLKACVPFVQLSVSPYCHIAVWSSKVCVLPP